MRKMESISGNLGALGLVVIASLLCQSVRTSLAPTNMVMVYLLAVVLAAAKLGLRPAILTAFLSVLSFDFLFIPPRFSLRVSDTEYLLTFFALFVVGLVVSTLVARIQEKVVQVEHQQAITSSLYSLTRELSVAADVSAIVEGLQNAVSRNLGANFSILLNRDGFLEPATNDAQVPLDEATMKTASWVVQSGRRAGAGAAAFPESPFLFMPLRLGNAVAGVMVMEKGAVLGNDSLQLLEAFAGQAAMALERVELARQAEEARLLREKSHLEQALLNSISHDLRTPLVTIAGVLDAMLINNAEPDQGQFRTMIATAAEEAGRLNRFVGSLLDMTRLEAGVLAPRLSPCESEDIIGCAVGAVEPRLGNHHVVTSVADNVPLVSVDLALLTQALVNLLDNALKYSPPLADITISAGFDGRWVNIAIVDKGPGVPVGQEERIFEKFYRLDVPERTGGTGLGLSIAKGIIEAHAGNILATNTAQGGLMVVVKLPPENLDGHRKENDEH